MKFSVPEMTSLPDFAQGPFWLDHSAHLTGVAQAGTLNRIFRMKTGRNGKIVFGGGGGGGGGGTYLR